MKKIAQSVYRRDWEQDDTRFRIAVMASVFCILENFQSGPGANQLSGQYVLHYYFGEKSVEKLA